jgi:hypothetical protein
MEELQERIAVKEGGRRRNVSKQRAIIKSVMAKALTGDAKSASLIVNLVARFLGQADDDERSTSLDADDLAVLRAFEDRVRRSKS